MLYLKAVSFSALPSVIQVLQVRDRGSWFGIHEDVPRYRKHVISPSMFPSGKGSKDSLTVSSSVEVNTDVADADMNDSTDMVEGEQETSITIDDSNKGDNLKTGEGTKDDCEFGEATISYKKLNYTSIHTEHSDYPLHRCMRIVPHDQNSGAFFIAVLHKVSPLNGNIVPHSFILYNSLFTSSTSYTLQLYLLLPSAEVW